MGIVSHCIRIGLGLGIRSGFGEGWFWRGLVVRSSNPGSGGGLLGLVWLGVFALWCLTIS